MRKALSTIFLVRLFLKLFLISTLVILSSSDLYAQEEPPEPITVTVDRNLVFGGFVQHPGVGSVSVSEAGTRTGSAVSFLTGFTYNSGQFYITGTMNTPILIEVAVNPITLSNGGSGTMTLTIDSWSFPTQPHYVLPSASAYVSFGGTLTIPAGSPSGSYSGSLEFIFTQNYE
jgi:hypothetical protein